MQLLHLEKQWVEELNKFLIIKEKPPIYKTKTGREKQRDNLIRIKSAVVAEELLELFFGN
ncbi:hypothetical protein [Lachnoanaerobaculum sp. ICM7]|uniref:hypothetical protein n=1 Tax=Lachnoanaerobaculum sp. ICM7 TaxID=936594 RepID=UPI0005544BA6|nr:hypothetical protein [Lachnoanaerobaculum sp. ICM7]